MPRRRFAPRLLPTVLAVIGVAAFVSLGNWQVGRAHEKEARAARLASGQAQSAIAIGQAQLDAHAMELQPVTARGRWVADKAVFLDNRTHQGRAGYHVFMPLALEGGALHVLVNRGWVPAPLRREDLPPVPAEPGVVEVSGTARIPASNQFEIAHEGSKGRLWQYLSLQRYRDWSKLPLQPLVIEQTSTAADGLVRDWPKPDAGAEKNRAYAFQWYALAATVLGLWGWFSLRKEEHAA